MTEHIVNQTRIAFIDISVFSDGAIRGGVLVTDDISRPYEFRVTSAINPTNLQKILYGKSLTSYVFGELICVPLLKMVKENINLAVCRDEHLLIARPEISFPLIVINKQGSGKINNTSRNFDVQTHKNFPGEKAHAEILLNELSRQLDVFEPFDRVQLAISEIHKQKQV